MGLRGVAQSRKQLWGAKAGRGGPSLGGGTPHLPSLLLVSTLRQSLASTYLVCTTLSWAMEDERNSTSWRREGGDQGCPQASVTHGDMGLRHPPVPTPVSPGAQCQQHSQAPHINPSIAPPSPYIPCKPHSPV